jgi:EAL domain-containing protein (putative c-di-GMP-specific phosphodiesterase class I)/CHASE2 domain-containing sensor protein
MFTRIASVLSSRSNQIVVAMALAIGALCTHGGWDQMADGPLERARERIERKAPSGDIVVVAIDQESMDRLDAWPWPRSTHGRLVKALSDAGVRQTLFDLDFSSSASDPKQDRLFADALAHSRNPVGMIGSADEVNGQMRRVEANPTLKPYVRTLGSWIAHDSETGAITLPYRETYAGKARESIAVVASTATPPADERQHPIDWSIEHARIPVFSYADVIEGKVPARALKGRTVLVGATAATLGDRWATPTGDRVPGVFIHAMGAETLAQGVPVPYGPWPLLALSIALTAAALRTRQRWAASLAIGATGTMVVGISWISRENAHIILDAGPAFVAILTALGMQGVAGVASGVLSRLTTDETTDLPNLTAMRIDNPKGKSTVTVRLRNHLETATALGPKLQAEMMRRVRDLIKVGAGDATVYQVDEQSFAWRTALDGVELSNSIEGLVALFRGGVPIEGRSVDAPVTAGICEHEDDVNVAVTSALLAADHAARQGLPWTRHQDNDRDAEWRVTMMSQLGRALSGDDEAGRVWVAYQPKYDLADGRITSAEALVRWNHPDRGPVRPDHFIPALEEAGQIEQLTLFVLETAIRDFAAIGGIGVAVNLSTRMLGGDRVVGPVQALLDKYGLPANLLTLEITESAVLTGEGAIDELRQLREMGVKISIDDYGTGQSTLNYLKRLPATELKVDQSFVRVVLTSRADEVMIKSTISLAHELGLKVVAEGVETADVLEALRNLDCDIIQGYHIGKPVPFADFVAEIAQEIVMPRKSAA